MCVICKVNESLRFVFRLLVRLLIYIQMRWTGNGHFRTQLVSLEAHRAHCGYAILLTFVATWRQMRKYTIVLFFCVQLFLFVSKEQNSFTIDCT